MTDVNNPASDTSTETLPDKKGQGTPTEKTFTQAELDAIISRRIAEVKSATENRFLSELGFEKPDDLKALVTKAKEKENADLSAAEKLQKQLDELTLKHNAALKLAADTQAARLVDKVSAELKTLALKARAEYPQDVLTLIENEHSEAFKALIKEDGSFDTKAAEALLEVVKKARPTWFGVTGQGSPSNREGRTPQPDINKLIGEKSLVRW